MEFTFSAEQQELAATVRQNAESARQANQLASGTSATAGKGGEEMARVVDTMAGISQSSRKIADILGIEPNAVYAREFKALKRFKAAWQMLTRPSEPMR